jgi:hypothetical protein
MKLRIFILLIIALLANSSCRKREYPPEQKLVQGEVFMMDALIDNVPVSLKAGSNSYYCYSSCKQATGGVYQFVSELRKYGCTSCEASFYMQINDRAPLPAGSAVTPDSVLRPGSFQYAPGSDYMNTFKFTPSFNKTATAWLWDFGDGTSSSLQSPAHNYSQAGKYKVCVKATGSAGCTDVACNDLTVFENGDVLFAGISAADLGQKKARFTAQVTGKEPLSITWHFGDGTQDTTRIAEHEYSWPGGYPVTLVVKDADGHIGESHYNYVTSGDASSCAVNFGMVKQSAVLSGLSKVKIRWTDNNGKVFVSDKVVQPATSSFEIISVSDFDRNEQGDRTKLLTMKINVLLSDGTRSIWMRSDNAVLAVAYK